MGKRVLVIEDNPVNMKVTASLLELEGHEVLQATDAVAAQELLGHERPDLILMDISMPGMDGLTLTRVLKADERFAEIPIVAVTASAMKGDNNRAMEAGCSGYISKPIDTRKFGRQIERFLADTATPAEGRPLRIVVVDDNRVDLKLMDAVLQISGHVVIGKESPEGAVSELAAIRPDAVLLDLMYPDTDGLAFVRLMKGAADTKFIPLVAVTAYPEVFAREDLLAAGCDDYMVKPIDTRSLAGRLQALVARSG